MSNNNEIVPVIGKKDQSPLSKLQKQFNYRTKRIKNLKKKIDLFKERIDTYTVRFHKEIMPIEDQMIEEKVEFLKILDESHADRFFKKKEKKIISQIIEQEAFELIQQLGMEELIELHDKHAEVDYTTSIKNEKESGEVFAKTFIEEMFGVKVDEVGDLNDPEAFFDLQEEVMKQMEEREQAYRAQRKQRKKTTAQQKKEEEREQKMKEEAQNLSKTSRTIYTSLVKELHPDAEPDETEKARKTEIMKKVTEAYKNNDFFELLRLQIEYKQGETNIENLQNDQLVYYNQILMEQVRDLQQEEYMLMYPPPPLNQIFQSIDMTKTYLKDQFTVGVFRAKNELKMYKNTNKYVSDKKKLRKYLKDFVQQPTPEEDFFGFDGFFGA
ncbi:J domain-containing protein [uncultured Microscilla sp.]|uniref:J domain-containing protein n=1 Tax=uncultured Microscilla sp. TaxID=432653 RepID=UPI0026194019|nr:J domain-containing protein [uncultured Microscilla sp.]